MNTRQAVGIVVVLMMASTITPVLAMSASEQRAGGQSNGNGSLATAVTNGTTNDTAPLGSQVSAFMQSSSASANSSMETGMWVARFNSSESNRSEMVDRRAQTLERRLDRLEGELENATSGDGNLSNVSQAGRIAALSAQITTLESTLNRTTVAASSAGVNTTRLEHLRQNASELRGQEVARLARNLTTVGPPADRGPPDNRTTGPPDNGTTGPPDNNTTGPPDDGTTGSPDNNSTGPPDDGTTGPPDENRSDDGTTSSPGNEKDGSRGGGSTGPPGSRNA